MIARRGSAAAAYASNPAGREQMIIQNLPLVHHVIGRLAIGMPAVLDREDLVAHGIIGLIQAIDRYDPSQGVPFAAWAAIRIRGAVLDAIRTLDLIDAATRHQVRALQEETSRLTTSLGRFPTDSEIQEALGLSAAQYASLLDAASCAVVSLDAAAESEGAPLADLIQSAAVDDPSERGAVLAMVAEALRRLDDRERLVLSLYYVEDLTLPEIAKVLGIHKTVAVRLHGRAILKLRTFLEVDAAAAPPAEENHEHVSIHSNGTARRDAPSPAHPAALPPASGAPAGPSRPGRGPDRAPGGGAGRRDTGPGRPHLSERTVHLGAGGR